MTITIRKNRAVISSFVALSMFTLVLLAISGAVCPQNCPHCMNSGSFSAAHCCTESDSVLNTHHEPAKKASCCQGERVDIGSRVSCVCDHGEVLFTAGTDTVTDKSSLTLKSPVADNLFSEVLPTGGGYVLNVLDLTISNPFAEKLPLFLANLALLI